MKETMNDHAQSRPITLRLRATGDAYDRAKAVADAMNLTMEQYLYRCLREGHLILRGRQAAAAAVPEEGELIPAYVRRASSVEPWGKED